MAKITYKERKVIFMKDIYVLVNKYPNKIEPNVCVFIQQLVWSFADEGYMCKVINPLPINLNSKYLKFPKHIIEKNENGKNIEIFYPKYISLGQDKKILQKFRVWFTTKMYIKAVDSILKKEKINNEEACIYSHFICPSGVAAAVLGKKYHIKSFMAHGEALYKGDIKYGNNRLKKYFENLTGVIAVSTQNKNYLINAGVIDAEKIGVFPNGYRSERFYKIDRNIAREHFGWNKEQFIVGFCGSFDVRKGILRLQSAVDMINDDNVVFACAGKGKLVPTSDKCILKNPINNDELVYFYNAIDVFCLPTQNEGCCNAIVEAIACGCPIISSDRKFNYDILDNNNSVLVNPDSIDEIRKAIEEIMLDREKLILMSESSLKKAYELTIENRIDNILKFILK